MGALQPFLSFAATVAIYGLAILIAVNLTWRIHLV